ncbi:glycosyltransferase family 9 protein [Fimbriiglobus ruber]|nr:glycosyltransferase family 9 protein [Fimbriiglobus ruber]
MLVEVPGVLARLLATCPGVDTVIAEGQPLPGVDFQCPLMSLPAVFGTTVPTIPNPVPYLSPDPGLLKHWGRLLADLRGFNVGIAWQGNPNHKWDRHRSVPVTAFAPLARVPGVRLVALQQGPALKQVDVLGGRFAVTRLPPRDPSARQWTFPDTAAVIRSLDLVVTVDTSVAHLAGALGVPTWVGLSTVVDWRWLLDREDCPWYPTVRLFRQAVQGEWAPVFDRIARELTDRLRVWPAGRGVPVELDPGDLLDRIAALTAAESRTREPMAAARVRAELAALIAARDHGLATTPESDRLFRELLATHQAGCDADDGVRRCDQAKDYGPAFVEAALAAYRANGRRGIIRGRLNDLLGVRGPRPAGESPSAAGPVAP